MSADIRTVHTDALETLGYVHTKQEGRDAVHLAVEPVTAAFKLHAGQDVGFDRDQPTKVSTNTERFLGIVDPFLRDPVFPDEQFWLMVYPRQINSLRHVWEHPMFPASGQTATAREAAEAPAQEPD